MFNIFCNKLSWKCSNVSPWNEKLRQFKLEFQSLSVLYRGNNFFSMFNTQPLLFLSKFATTKKIWTKFFFPCYWWCCEIRLLGIQATASTRTILFGESIRLSLQTHNIRKLVQTCPKFTNLLRLPISCFDILSHSTSEFIH